MRSMQDMGQHAPITGHATEHAKHARYGSPCAYHRSWDRACTACKKWIIWAMRPGMRSMRDMDQHAPITGHATEHAKHARYGSACAYHRSCDRACTACKKWISMGLSRAMRPGMQSMRVMDRHAPIIGHGTGHAQHAREMDQHAPITGHATEHAQHARYGPTCTCKGHETEHEQHARNGSTCAYQRPHATEHAEHARNESTCAYQRP